jgi:putative FmdB family regulatory protein
MPTYEYECKNCGHSFETFQSMSDEPLTSCPRCGREVRRLINGGSGVIFKGSGFYVTDKSGSKAAPKPGAKSADPACAGCAKAESGSCPAADAPGKGDASEKKAAG